MSMLAQAGGVAGYGAQFLAWFGSLFGSHAFVAIAILKIIGLNIILSGDNAVVIALACRGLPEKQRRWGIILGAGAAVVLRIIFTVIVLFLLNQQDVPWVRLVGGILLLWIAIKLLTGGGESEEDIKSGSSLWEAVKIVTIADVVMSLDNVLAIAAAAQSAPAHQQVWLVLFGLLISIPLVVAGSTLITNLLNRYPILIWVGAALLGYVAGELIGSEPTLKAIVEAAAEQLGLTVKWLVRLLEISGILIVVVGGWLIIRRRRMA